MFRVSACSGLHGWWTVGCNARLGRVSVWFFWKAVKGSVLAVIGRARRNLVGGGQGGPGLPDAYR